MPHKSGLKVAFLFWESENREGEKTHGFIW